MSEHNPEACDVCRAQEGLQRMGAETVEARRRRQLVTTAGELVRTAALDSLRREAHLYRRSAERMPADVPDKCAKRLDQYAADCCERQAELISNLDIAKILAPLLTPKEPGK